MDWHNEINSPEPPERDPLDALLAQAAWPEPRGGQLARLRSHWRKLIAPRSTGWWLAAAAAILVGGVATWYAVENRQQFDRPAAVRPGSDTPLVEDTATSVPSTSVVPTQEAALVEQPPVEKSPDISVAHDGSRPPNDYERLVLAFSIRQQSGLPTPQRRKEQAARLAEALGSLSVDAAADPVLLAAPFLADRERYERLLLNVLRRPNDRQRSAALQLLPHLATWRSVPLLRELARTGQASGSAKLALARLGTPAEAAWFVEAEGDRTARIELLTVLAERGERAAVQRFLRFVADPRIADEALEALDAIDEPPLDALFAALIGNDVGERRAAARALGRINGPTVTERLVALALDGIYRQEAMLALIACRGSEAREFVQHARRDLTLVAAVQAAEYQFQRITHSDERSIP